MIEETMRNELKDVLDKGYTLLQGFLESDGVTTDDFYFYLIEPNTELKDRHPSNIYGNMTRTKTMTKKEIAFAAAYFLLGKLDERGLLDETL